MGKRKLSGKTILKLTGAFFALIYLGFCLYAGITGKFLKMQEVEHVMRFGELKNWVGGGMAAVMIAALCLHSAFKDLNFQKERKKSDVPFLLLMILPIVFLLLLESYRLDRYCPLRWYCSFLFWYCMDSDVSESMDCSIAFAGGFHER